MKQAGEHAWEVTEPTPIEIGMPASPPPAGAIEALHDAVAQSGATRVYWFWVSLSGDPPHLGLAVAPNDNDVVARVGQAVEPIWKRYSPDNTVFDILRLGSPELDRVIENSGRLLYSASSESKKPWWRFW